MARQKLLLRLAFVSALVGSGGTLAFRTPCHAGGGIIIPSGTARAGSSAVPPTAMAVVRGGGPTASSSSLDMAPRFDKSSQKWFVTDPEVSARLKEMDLAYDIGHTYAHPFRGFCSPDLRDCNRNCQTNAKSDRLLLLSPFPPQLYMYSSKFHHNLRWRVRLRDTASSGASTAPVRCRSSSASSMPNRTSRRCSSTWRRRDATAS